MTSLDYQMIRQAIHEEFAAILGSPDEECEGCPSLAAIREMRDHYMDLDRRIAESEGHYHDVETTSITDEIAELKARIADLEKRPYISGFDHLMRSGLVSYNCTNR